MIQMHYIIEKPLADHVGCNWEGWTSIVADVREVQKIK